MSELTDVLQQIQDDIRNLRIRVDKIEPREIDDTSKKNILDGLDVVTDAGTANPDDGELEIVGGDSIDTAGADNTVTINVTDDSIGLDKLAVGNVMATSRRFLCDFNGHSWPDTVEAAWEPAESGGVIYLGWEHMCGVLRKDSEYQYRAVMDRAVQIASGVTNVCTNPSAETGVVGWGTTNAGLNQSADDYVYGDYCFAMLATAMNGYVNFDFAVAGGATYTVGIWIKTTSSQVWIRLRDQVAGVVLADLYCTGSGKWEYLTVTGTMGAGAGNMRLFVLDSRAAGWDNVYFDAVMIWNGAFSTPYVDGSLGQGHVWTGAAHGSTSTRTAATLTYPNDTLSYPDGDCYEQLTIMGRFIPAWPSTAGGAHVLWDVRGVNNNNRIFVDYDAAADQWRVYINGAYRLLSGAQTFSSWSTHFIAVTIDFDTDTYCIYVNDDVLVEDTTALTPPAFGTNAFHLGDDINNTNEFGGLIDEFAIYPYAMSADEINAIYKFGNPLISPITNTPARFIPGEWESSDFNGDAFSTTAWTTYDIVDGFGIPYGAKAISVFTLIRDSGAAGQTFQLRKDATHSPSLQAWTNAGANMWINTNAIVPVANGRTVDYQTTASGAGTLDIYWRIYAIYL